MAFYMPQNFTLKLIQAKTSLPDAGRLELPACLTFLFLQGRFGLITKINIALVFK